LTGRVPCGHESAAGSGHTEERGCSYCEATTLREVAAAAVACGDVVAQVTLPDEFVQLYHVPPVASWTFTVVAAVGLIVNVTESRFVGVVASRL
jgi:hypothetical protein